MQIKKSTIMRNKCVILFACPLLFLFLTGCIGESKKLLIEEVVIFNETRPEKQIPLPASIAQEIGDIYFSPPIQTKLMINPSFPCNRFILKIRKKTATFSTSYIPREGFLLNKKLSDEARRYLDDCARKLELHSRNPDQP